MQKGHFQQAFLSIFEVLWNLIFFDKEHES